MARTGARDRGRRPRDGHGHRVAQRPAQAAPRRLQGAQRRRARPAFPRRRRGLPQLRRADGRDRRASTPPTPALVEPRQHRHAPTRAARSGRVKISDNVATDEDEPEVLFTAGQHAREHLTVEMALYLLNELTSKYATDARVKAVVDTREIWIVPNMNPDGGEYDIADRQLPARGARTASRTPARPPSAPTSTATGASTGAAAAARAARSPRRPTAAPSPFSAPETQRVRDFVNSRVVGGVQQIKAGIDFHTYSELVLWPYGYTTADTAPALDADARRHVRDARPAAWPRPTATRPSRRPTSTSPTARSTTGCGARTGSSATRSRCTRGPRTRASTRPTR